MYIGIGTIVVIVIIVLVVFMLRRRLARNCVGGQERGFADGRPVRTGSAG